MWHILITKVNKRVKKVACRIILKDQFTTYEDTLLKLGLENLEVRREKLYLKFAQSCINKEKTKGMFSLKPTGLYILRNNEKYKVNFASTSRLLYSPIPQMQRLLNSN